MCTITWWYSELLSDALLWAVLNGIAMEFLVFQTQGKLKVWILAKEAFLKPLIIHRSHWQSVIKVIWQYCGFSSRPSEKEMLKKK